MKKLQEIIANENGHFKFSGKDQLKILGLIVTAPIWVPLGTIVGVTAKAIEKVKGKITNKSKK